MIIMDGLKETVKEVADALAEAEKKRDLALAESRKIIRLSKNVIHAIHVDADCTGSMKEMEDRMSSLISGLSGEMMYSGPAADAMMEFAEAEILFDVISDRRIRSPSELGITPQSWAMGLADTVGEIRRVIVRKLMDGDDARAKVLFAAMEDIAEELLMFDVPDAVVPLRRKQDVTRGIVEKTRSDMLNASFRS